MNAYCAAVDWGTTSFRLWLLDAAGEILAERRSGEGMLAAGPDGFAAILDAHLSAVGAAADLPVIACGMVGETKISWNAQVALSLRNSVAQATACPQKPNGNMRRTCDTKTPATISSHKVEAHPLAWTLTPNTP